MRVLLVHPHLFHHPTATVPSGLAWLAAALRARGAQVALLDLAFVWNRSRVIPAAIGELEPDVIGIGVAHLDNECAFHSITFLPQIRWVIDRIRAASRAPIVAGGFGITQCARDVLTYLGLAHGFQGGDVAEAARWIEAVGGRDDRAEVAGAIRWTGAAYESFTAAARPTHGLPIPCSAAHDLVDYSPYRRTSAAAVVPIVLDRGGVPARRPAAEIADELGALAATRSVSRALLAGLTVGLDPAHDDELLETLASRGAPLATEIQLAARAATRERVALLRASGARAIRLRLAAPASGEVSRPSRLAAERDALPRALERIGGAIPIRLEVAIGGLDESADSLARTLALVDALHPRPAAIELVPGVRLWDEPGEGAVIRRGGFAGDSPIWPRFGFAAEIESGLAERLRQFASTRPGVSVDSTPTRRGNALPTRSGAAAGSGPRGSRARRWPISRNACDARVSKEYRSACSRCNIRRRHDRNRDERRASMASPTTTTVLTQEEIKVPWKLFRGNHQRSGQVAAMNPVRLTGVRWELRVGRVTWSSPAIDDDTVYIGLEDGALLAVDARSGKRVWRYRTGGAVLSSPAIDGELVLVGSEDQNLHAVDRKVGVARWTAPLGSAVTSSPLVKGGRIFVGSWDENLYCLSEKDGAVLWSHPTGGRVWSSPALADDTVVVASASGYILALDPRDGSRKWRFKARNRIYSTPAIAHGMVFVGCHDGNLYAIDMKTGKRRYAVETKDKIRSSPAVVEGKVLFGSEDGKFHCIDALSGEQRWVFDAKGGIDSSPAVSGDTVLFGTLANRVHALDVNNGRERWGFSTDDWVDSSPALWGRLIVFGSYDGHLYGLEFDTE
ncbi:MAG: PQQ-binding-like beta-propeller repeat protein [bacterium]